MSDPRKDLIRAKLTLTLRRAFDAMDRITARRTIAAIIAPQNQAASIAV